VGPALFLSALALRVADLNSLPLRGTEFFSIYWSRLDIGFLLGPGARIETNPPGYFLLLHGWTGLFGTGAGAVRLLSVLLSTAQVPVTYALGSTLRDRRTALLAGALAALDPAALMFGQMARPYAALGLLDSLALLGLARHLRRPGAADRTAWRWPALFLAAAAASLLFHYASLLFVAACIGAWAIVLAKRPFEAAAARAWAGAALLLALAAAGPLALALSLRHSANLDWIGPLTPITVLGFVIDLLTHPGMPRDAATLDVCATLLAVVIAAIPRLRFDRATRAVLVLAPALFCLLLIGASLERPMPLARAGAWLVVPLCVLLAGAVTVQPTAIRRGIIGGAVLLSFLFGGAHYFLATRNEDWLGAARLLAAEPRCAGPVLVSGDTALGLHYHDATLDRRPVILFGGADRERRTAQFLLNQRVMNAPTMPADAVAAFAASHKGTAVVLRAAFQTDAPAALLAALTRAPYRTRRGDNLLIACF
jgi:hypothetical protein